MIQDVKYTSATKMKVILNGWFAGQHVGSGQYTDQLLAAFRALAPADGPTGDHLTLVQPSGRGALAKLWFEQVTFPRHSAGADIAHVPYWAPPLRPIVPTVVTVHDLIPLLLPDYRRDIRVRAYTTLVARATPYAAAVLADSEHTAADIRSHLDVDPARVHVVPLGVAMPEDRAGLDARAADLRTRRRLPARFGLYLGGFDARKNLLTLLRAWRDVYAGTRTPLVIAGRLPAAGDDLFRHPSELARQAGLAEEAYILLGPVGEGEKWALYRAAAVFAFPSRYEGFGLPPLEAMAVGTPVVAADASSLPEVVGDAGLLVAPEDVAGWASAIRGIVGDSGKAAALAEAGRSRAAGFTWQRTAAMTREVYSTVAFGPDRS